MDKYIEWSVCCGTAGNGRGAFIGKWLVGNVIYDGFTSVSDIKKYKVSCRLPGIKNSYLGHFETEDEGKAALVNSIKHWFDNLPKGLVTLEGGQ